MVNTDLVSRKVSRARGRLADAEALYARANQAAGGSLEARDLATFYLFLAMQEVIDLSAHWVSDAGWDVPDDAGGAFDVLADRDAISRDLATAMRGIVGVRNRIAHGYATLDPERLQEETTSGIAAMRSFLVLAARAAGLEG